MPSINTYVYSVHLNVVRSLENLLMMICRQVEGPFVSPMLSNLNYPLR